MKKFSWTPYLLLLPSLLYLVIFFAYPMYESFRLAFQKDSAILSLRNEPDEDAELGGQIKLQTIVTVLDRLQLEETLPNGRTRPIFWFQVEGEDINGKTVTGWVNQKSVFIENRRTSETA
ncbi:MAG: SH3 domain-containing protein, partial [Anaerolineae bacterium]